MLRRKEGGGEGSGDAMCKRKMTGRRGNGYVVCKDSRREEWIEDGKEGGGVCERGKEEGKRWHVQEGKEFDSTGGGTSMNMRKEDKTIE